MYLITFFLIMIAQIGVWEVDTYNHNVPDYFFHKHDCLDWSLGSGYLQPLCTWLLFSWTWLAWLESGKWIPTITMYLITFFLNMIAPIGVWEVDTYNRNVPDYFFFNMIALIGVRKVDTYNQYVPDYFFLEHDCPDWSLGSGYLQSQCTWLHFSWTWLPWLESGKWIPTITMYLITFFLNMIAPIGVWEVDMTSCFLHYPFYVVTSLANHMRVVCMGHIHFQSNSITLKKNTTSMILIYRHNIQVWKQIWIMINTF